MTSAMHGEETPMSRASTKTTRDVERHYFEQFRRAYGLPDGNVAYGDKPDVLLKGERTIGVEITRFYLQSGHLPQCEQKQRRLRESVVSDAQNVYRAAGGRSIELTVGFNTDNPIFLPRMKILPRELADLAGSIDSQQSGAVDPDLFQEIREVNYVYVNRREYEDPKWRVSPVHTVESMSIVGLQSIVRAKESKSAGYKLCDAYWLLVVVDWTDWAQEQEIRIDGLKLTSDVFEKVIVYKPGFEHIMELI